MIVKKPRKNITAKKIQLAESSLTTSVLMDFWQHLQVSVQGLLPLAVMMTVFY